MAKKTKETYVGSLDFSKIDYRLSHAISKEIKSEQSDRGAAIMASTYLEEFLTEVVRTYLVADEKISDSLFDISGPLGTFSAKSRIAFGLRILGKAAYSDINHIREIRNRFAHFLVVTDGRLGLDQVTFKSQEIKDRCKALRFPDNFRSIPEYNREPGSYTPADLINENTINDPRMRYVGTCIGLGIALQAQRVIFVEHQVRVMKSLLVSDRPRPVDY